MLTAGACTSPVARATRDAAWSARRPGHPGSPGHSECPQGPCRAALSRAGRAVRGRARRVEGRDRGLLRRERARRSVLSASRPRCRPGEPRRRPDDLVPFGSGGFRGGRAVDLAHRQHCVSSRYGRSRAVVTGCSYDPGSHFRSGAPAAPAWLGGASRADGVRHRHDRDEGFLETREVRGLVRAQSLSGRPVPRFSARRLDGPRDHGVLWRRCPGPRHDPCRQRRRSRLDRFVDLVLGVVARQPARPWTLYGRCLGGHRALCLARHRIFVERPQRGARRSRTSGQLLDSAARWRLSRHLVSRSLGRSALEGSRSRPTTLTSWPARGPTRYPRQAMTSSPTCPPPPLRR